MRKLLGERGEGEVTALVLLALVALLGYGAYALWRDNYGAPDDKCFWLTRGENGWDHLTDGPPPRGCVHLDFLRAHAVKSSTSTDELAGFAQKAGRRICGQLSTQCPQPKP